MDAKRSNYIVNNAICYLIYLLIACGCSQDKKQSTYIEAQYISFYNEFLKDAETYNKIIPNIKVSIITVDSLYDYPEAYAVCYGSERTVRIKRVFMDYAQSFLDNEDPTDDIYYYYAVKYIIYHELGHCLLNKKHSYDPKDIMYEYTNIITIFPDNLDYALPLLFK